MRSTLFVILIVSIGLVASAAFPTIRSDRRRRQNRPRHKTSFNLFLATRKSTPFDDSIYGPFEEGTIGISRQGGSGNHAVFSLYYRIYHHQKQKQQQGPESKLPLVVLHGGPSLPSQYLYPMVSHLPADRPIVFYDQLGCGKSDEPKQKHLYSIDQSVSDLDTILRTLGLNRIHLFGHSYGGNLAYEYAKKRPEMVQSLLLSNAATSMKVAGDAYDRLAARNPLGFWKERVCSVDSPALDHALQHVGSVWAGMDVVLDYAASPPAGSGGGGGVSSLFPRSVLAISCANDFGFESSEGWAEVLAGSGVDVEHKRMENCAHYPHLEDGACFGRLLNDFMSKHDT